MPHIMFAGLAHEGAYSLSKRLASLASMDRVFLTDSGSVAVETAMKMAVQYWKNKGFKRKDKFVSFSNAYHGDTMGCMSLCDPDDGMHVLFHDYMPKQYSIALPTEEYAFAEFETLLSDLEQTIAAVILEPLVQGAGGMKFHSPDVVAEIYRICKKKNILFIADEIMTGFGRTGHFFACDEAGIKPDILCLGKALTGGVMSLAAVVTHNYIYQAFLGDSLDTALMCGPTYMANPLSCAAANASLDLFAQENRQKAVSGIEDQLYQELKLCKDLPNVIDVRVKGAIGVVQIKNISYKQILELRKKFIAEGIWLRPFSDVIYIMPAFTISHDELTKITQATKKILKSFFS